MHLPCLDGVVEFVGILPSFSCPISVLIKVALTSVDPWLVAPLGHVVVYNLEVLQCFDEQPFDFCTHFIVVLPYPFLLQCLVLFA
jgi:hypothetical protein